MSEFKSFSLSFSPYPGSLHLPQASYTQALLHDLELSLPVSSESVFPIVPDPHKLVDILLMDLIDIGWVRILSLLDTDRLADDNVHRTSVRH